jgi:hypothetical protein
MKSLMVAVLLLAVFGAPAPARAADWRMIVERQDYDVYSDAQSVRTTSKTSVSVWCKTTARTDRYRAFMVDVRKKGGLSAEGYDRYGYTLSTEEINCMNTTYRNLSATDYDLSDKRLDAVFPVMPWRHITQDSTYYFLTRRVCGAVGEMGYWNFLEH